MSTIAIITPQMFTAAKDDWETPQDLFDLLNKAYGPFDIDVAATSVNNKCQLFYSPEDDGLLQPWLGKIYCNPPYGREIGSWVEKAAREVREERCECAVLLLPARTDTRWFQKHILGKAGVVFLAGRIKFVGAKSNAPFPSMVVIFRKTPNA